MSEERANIDINNTVETFKDSTKEDESVKHCQNALNFYLSSYSTPVLSRKKENENNNNQIANNQYYTSEEVGDIYVDDEESGINEFAFLNQQEIIRENSFPFDDQNAIEDEDASTTCEADSESVLDNTENNELKIDDECEKEFLTSSGTTEKENTQSDINCDDLHKLNDQHDTRTITMPPTTDINQRKSSSADGDDDEVLLVTPPDSPYLKYNSSVSEDNETDHVHEKAEKDVKSKNEQMKENFGTREENVKQDSQQPDESKFVPSISRLDAHIIMGNDAVGQMIRREYEKLKSLQAEMKEDQQKEKNETDPINSETNHEEIEGIKSEDYDEEKSDFDEDAIIVSSEKESGSDCIEEVELSGEKDNLGNDQPQNSDDNVDERNNTQSEQLQQKAKEATIIHQALSNEAEIEMLSNNETERKLKQEKQISLNSIPIVDASEKSEIQQQVCTNQNVTASTGQECTETDEIFMYENPTHNNKPSYNAEERAVALQKAREKKEREIEVEEMIDPNEFNKGNCEQMEEKEPKKSIVKQEHIEEKQDDNQEFVQDNSTKDVENETMESAWNKNETAIKKNASNSKDYEFIMKEIESLKKENQDILMENEKLKENEKVCIFIEKKKDYLLTFFFFFSFLYMMLLLFDNCVQNLKSLCSSHQSSLDILQSEKEEESNALIALSDAQLEIKRLKAKIRQFESEKGVADLMRSFEEEIEKVKKERDELAKELALVGIKEIDETLECESDENAKKANEEKNIDSSIGSIKESELDDERQSNKRLHTSNDVLDVTATPDRVMEIGSPTVLSSNMTSSTHSTKGRFSQNEDTESLHKQISSLKHSLKKAQKLLFVLTGEKQTELDAKLNASISSNCSPSPSFPSRKQALSNESNRNSTTNVSQKADSRNSPPNVQKRAEQEELAKIQRQSEMRKIALEKMEEKVKSLQEAMDEKDSEIKLLRADIGVLRTRWEREKENRRIRRMQRKMERHKREEENEEEKEILISGNEEKEYNSVEAHHSNEKYKSHSSSAGDEKNSNYEDDYRKSERVKSNIRKLNEKDNILDVSDKEEEMMQLRGTKEETFVSHKSKNLADRPEIKAINPLHSTTPFVDTSALQSSPQSQNVQSSITSETALHTSKPLHHGVTKQSTNLVDSSFPLSPDDTSKHSHDHYPDTDLEEEYRQVIPVIHVDILDESPPHNSEHLVTASPETAKMADPLQSNGTNTTHSPSTFSSYRQQHIKRQQPAIIPHRSYEKSSPAPSHELQEPSEAKEKNERPKPELNDTPKKSNASSPSKQSLFAQKRTPLNSNKNPVKDTTPIAKQAENSAKKRVTFSPSPHLVQTASRSQTPTKASNAPQSQKPPFVLIESHSRFSPSSAHISRELTRQKRDEQPDSSLSSKEKSNLLASSAVQNSALRRPSSAIGKRSQSLQRGASLNRPSTAAGDVGMRSRQADSVQRRPIFQKSNEKQAFGTAEKEEKKRASSVQPRSVLTRNQSPATVHFQQSHAIASPLNQKVGKRQTPEGIKEEERPASSKRQIEEGRIHQTPKKVTMASDQNRIEEQENEHLSSQVRSNAPTEHLQNVDRQVDEHRKHPFIPRLNLPVTASPVIAPFGRQEAIHKAPTKQPSEKPFQRNAVFSQQPPTRYTYQTSESIFNKKRRWM
ncbi:uncharacterized protein MONOS_8201 [Monocercomonoides exilis]|uniref:uncharacterized protein n=1 Tax=Monocercomonoides exilis TaxID=2049356 RepID=UPI00355AA13C|nr:hypothetical protein MONOS_8201 [Monocercomonoides exilis]